MVAESAKTESDKTHALFGAWYELRFQVETQMMELDRKLSALGADDLAEDLRHGLALLRNRYPVISWVANEITIEESLP